jgi:hypothetical protein
MRTTPFYLIDELSKKYIGFQYIGMSSEDIEFYLTNNQDEASGFMYEETADLYRDKYKRILNKESYIFEDLKKYY